MNANQVKHRTNLKNTKIISAFGIAAVALSASIASMLEQPASEVLPFDTNMRMIQIILLAGAFLTRAALTAPELYEKEVLEAMKHRITTDSQNKPVIFSLLGGLLAATGWIDGAGMENVMHMAGFGMIFAGIMISSEYIVTQKNIQLYNEEHGESFHM